MGVQVSVPVCPARQPAVPELCRGSGGGSVAGVPTGSCRHRAQLSPNSEMCRTSSTCYGPGTRPGTGNTKMKTRLSPGGAHSLLRKVDGLRRRGLGCSSKCAWPRKGAVGKWSHTSRGTGVAVLGGHHRGCKC